MLIMTWSVVAGRQQEGARDVAEITSDPQITGIVRHMAFETSIPTPSNAFLCVYYVTLDGLRKRRGRMNLI